MHPSVPPQHPAQWSACCVCLWKDERKLPEHLCTQGREQVHTGHRQICLMLNLAPCRSRESTERQLGTEKTQAQHLQVGSADVGEEKM